MNRSENAIRRTAPSWTVMLLALLLAASTAASQDSNAAIGSAAADSAKSDDGAAAEIEVPPTPPVVRAAQRLVAQLDAVSDEIEDLNAQIKDAEGEDRHVLEKQNIDAKLEFLELTGRLVKNLLQQEDQQLDTKALRAKVEQAVVQLTPAIVTHIEQAESVLGELRKQRESLPPGELLAFEQQLRREIDWLDSLYQAYVDNFTQLEQLALPSGSARTDLRERLENRAALDAGRIELSMRLLSELQRRAGESPEDLALQGELAALGERLTTVTTSLTKLVKHMETMGLDATEFQQLLITSTGEVTSDIFKAKVAIGLVQGWIRDVRDWVRDHGPAAFFKILVFILILAVARLVANVTKRVLERAFGASRVQTSQLLTRMTITIARNGVLAVGFLVALSQLGIELAPLLAGLGIAGFILGFALQDSLANFASGMMILGYRPFDVGDLIEAAGVRGQVSHMSLVNTTIMTFDNRTLIVPNNKIWGDVITNITTQDRRRVDLEFTIAYSADIDQTERVLLQVLTDNDRVLDDPAPLVKLHELGERGYVFIVRPWVETGDYLDVRWDLTREVTRRLHAEGIRIPYPRRDVYVHHSDPEADTQGPG